MRAVPFFHDAEPEFVTAIITKLEFEVYLDGDVIIREGELGTEMYFLKSGVVSVSCGGESTDDLTDGSYFGGELIFSFFFFGERLFTKRREIGGKTFSHRGNLKTFKYLKMNS